MKLILQLLFVSLLTIQSLAQTTSTYSGSTSGNSNNVAVASALWGKPYGMCYDGAGRMWVTDDEAHCVKVITGGTVYNRVGSQFAPGTPGAYGYANAYSSSAKFNHPRGIICDASGNIYVCDWMNNAIRKIDAFVNVGNSQGVTTFCGAPETTGIAQSGTTDGPASTARFNGPSGICKDNSGNFYVTDELNNTIRKIVIATGAVSTLCGTASGSTGGLVDGNYATCKFKWPRGITFSASENALYVCDFGNSRIRKIDLTAGTVSIWAGGTNGFQGSDGHRINAVNIKAPECIILDQAGNQIFSSSSNAHTLRRVEKATDNVFTFAGVHQSPGSTDGVYISAKFNEPAGLLLASDNYTLYVCDQLNFKIRKVDLRPVVDFYASQTSFATGTTITIKDTSLSMVSSRTWTITPGVAGTDFIYMNSTTATSPIPQLKFNNPGTYTVKLDATNTYGTGTLTRTGYLVVSNSTGQPTADFTVDKQIGPVSTVFMFTNQTTNSAGCTYLWSFNPSNSISYLGGTTQNSINPQVRFPAVGFYSVTLAVTHPSFTVAPKTKTNYIQVTADGINDVTNKFYFGVYPNPNKGNFNLVTTESLKQASLSVIDIQGKTVTTIKLEDNQEQNISLPTLTKGIYFIKITSADKVATNRLVIE